MGYRMNDSKGASNCCGNAKAGAKLNMHSLTFHFSKVLLGSHEEESLPARSIPRYLRRLEQGPPGSSRFVVNSYTPDRINEAEATMKNDQISGHIIIDL